MKVKDSKILIFDIIKEDYEQKLKDVSEMERKLSYLLSVDSILVGLITIIIELASLEPGLKQLYSWPIAISLLTLLISMSIGIETVFPKKIESELKIEGVLESYNNSTDDEFLSQLYGTLIDLTKNLRTFINNKGRYIQISWILTEVSLIVMVSFIWFIGFM